MVYVPVSPSALQADHRAQRDDESEAYEATADGVSEHAVLRQSETAAPAESPAAAQ